MKLIAFKSEDNEVIYIDPDKIEAVMDSDRHCCATKIYTRPECAYVVAEPIEDVLRKLYGSGVAIEA